MDLEATFNQWWEASYGRPPGTHAVMTHAAFAQYILDNHERPSEPPCPLHEGKD
jgi:hypothetical protein